MQVLLVSYRFPPDTVGGIERYTQGLAAELTKAGHMVTVVARRTEPGKANIRLTRERLKDGTVVYRVIGPDIRFDRFLEHHDQLDRLFSTALLESKPDIVHINHIMGFSPRIVRLSQRLGAAVVVSLHDFFFACPRIHLRKPLGAVCEGPAFGRECATSCFPGSNPDGHTTWGLRAMYFSRTLARTQALIAYSDYVAAYFRNFIGGLKPIHIIPNAVPEELVADAPFPTNGTRSKQLSLAYCGTVTNHKGPHVILEALHAARLESCTLLIIGHAPERDYVRRLRKHAEAIPGLTIKFYGKYERKELRTLLIGVDCVVVPSLVPEAGPIVPREALACGVPVIAAHVGALNEVIIDGENGFTFDPTRPEELASILRRMNDEPHLLPALREAARKVPSFTLAEHAQAVCRIYETALRNVKDNPPDRRDDAELNMFHESLVRFGCDASRQLKS
jgi:glycosyltransferase involved in cell wall biosynthesis